jgi:DNA polymerase III subunit gamma/tau
VALDTKYRPLRYEDVLGQEAATTVCQQFVKEGKGFHQSYVFCGQHGSGKTTTARILARGLLCGSPKDGAPCDECASCKVFLTPGAVHESFEELDAASKSGKADLERIIEDVSYGTFSGKRRIYLFDESHRLSKAALDILLKPMEDCVEGSEDKKLICIFCTTEPEKMRSTIFSRCAPAFVIRAVEPEIIAKRLAYVCDQEGIEYDQDALVTIAEVTECHIRDALKTVEGVSMLGTVNRDNVFQYLQLGANDLALDLLEALGTDLPEAVRLATQMAMDVSPSAAYERLSEAAMCAYRTHLGVGKVPTQWSPDRMKVLGQRGEALLGIASRFSAPPHRPSRHTLVLDVGTAHYALVSKTPAAKVASLVLEVSGAPSAGTNSVEVSSEGTISEKKSQTTGTVPADEPSTPTATAAPTATRNEGGVWIDPRGIGQGPSSNQVDASTPVGEAVSDYLDPHVFRELVRHHLREMRVGRKGQSG